MNPNRSSLRIVIAFTAAFAAAVQPAVFAQATKKPATAPAAKLPSAEKIMDDSSAAMGGSAAMKKITSQVASGTIELPAQKITGTFEQKIKLPNKFWMSVDIASFGKSEQGYDGTVGWSKDPINGLRSLKGSELNQIQSQVDQIKTDWRQQFKKPEMLGIRKVGTTPAYAVRLTSLRKGVDAIVNYYDIKTKLLLRSDIVMETPQGKIPTQNFFSDYRVVSGMKQPFMLRQVLNGQEIQTRFKSMEFSVPVDETIFAKPADAAPAAPAAPKS